MIKDYNVILTNREACAYFNKGKNVYFTEILFLFQLLNINKIKHAEMLKSGGDVSRSSLLELGKYSMNY
jgi:hypothetical protein